MSEIHKWVKKNYEKMGYDAIYDNENKAIIIEHVPKGSEKSTMQITNVIDNKVVFTTGMNVIVNDVELNNMLESMADVNGKMGSGCFETDPEGSGEKYVCYRSSICMNENDVISFRTFKRHVKMGFDAVEKHINDLIPEPKEQKTESKDKMYG